MTTFLLPEQDPDPAGRAAGISASAKAYDYEQSSGFPMSTYVDQINDFGGPIWLTDTLKQLLAVRANMESYFGKTKFHFQKQLTTISASNFADAIKTLIKSKADASNLVSGYLMPNLGSTSETTFTVADYRDIFSKDPVPEIAARFDTEETFAYTFVAGANPIMLRRMQQIPSNFPITSAHMQAAPALQGDDLGQALHEGRVFFCDYGMLAPLRNGQHAGKPRYAVCPLVAFAVPRGQGAIVAFAIQCGQDPSARQIYTPADGYSWKLAKNCVLSAHNTFHETTVHLIQTHLILEPMAIAFRRCFSPRHPVQALLNHHFEGTLFINDSAVHKLIQPGNQLDGILSCDIQSVYPFVADQRLNYVFTDHYQPQRFATNQTSDTSAIKLYPYRDDSLLVWNAIADWMSSFVQITYSSDAALGTDPELQAWAAEIASPTQGRVQGFPKQITSRQQLADILTMIIFTAGPQHAAVNFGQKTEFTFIPANPIAIYAPEPLGTGHSEADYLASLPPIDVAIGIYEIMNLLGSVYYTQLGHYRLDFEASPYAAAIARLRVTLSSIEDTITARNKSRIPYLHMLPSRIPQSINI